MTRRQAITVTLGTVGAATLGGTTDAAAPPAPSKAKRKGDAERQHAWVVTDVEHDLFVPELALGPDDLGPKAPGCSMTKRVLQGGLRSGVDVVEVDNGLLRFVVVPTRGMGIRRAQCGDVRLGWDSPVRGPVHPALVRLDEPDGLGWLAGFDEMLVRCGLEYNGGPEFHPSGILRYGLHGRIANTPAHKVTLAVDPVTGARCRSPASWTRRGCLATSCGWSRRRARGPAGRSSPSTIRSKTCRTSRASWS